MKNGGGENDEVFGGMWEAVETSTGKVRMGETKGRGWEKEGRKIKEEETEKGEDNGSKESSRGMGNMG